MTRHGAGLTEITPDLVLRAYRAGLFPMAERRDGDRLYWLDPELRGVQPLDGFHLPRRLARTVLAGTFEVRCDTAFAEVMHGCAAATPDRPETWINPEIERLFGALHVMGHAHSVECWQDGTLVGGLYGVALGGAFFGESMYSEMRDASKIALVYLCARLIHGGFVMLDTQFVTDHLRQFGTIEVDRAEFHGQLERAIRSEGDFFRLEREPSPQRVLDIVLARTGA